MRVSTEDLVELVNRKGLPMAEVMELTGMTRQGIWKRLKKVGEHVPRRAPGGAPCKVVEQSCAFCGEPVKKYRRQMAQLTQMKAFCNMQCYADSLAQHPYVQWRQGCRRARVLVAQHYPLQDEQIVHHKDGDNRNNDLANLAVFASNADHVAHHRGRAVPVLFDGAVRMQTVMREALDFRGEDGRTNRDLLRRNDAQRQAMIERMKGGA